MSENVNTSEHSSNGQKKNQTSSQSSKMSKRHHSSNKKQKKKKKHISSSESDSETDSEDSGSTDTSTAQRSSASESPIRSNIKRSKNLNLIRRKYLCRKCRAHGKEVSVWRHKRRCPYRECQCNACSLVNYGRFIVAKQIALYRY